MAQTGGDRPSTDFRPPADPPVEAPRRAVFRMPLVAVVLLPVLAAFCLGPIATVNVWWALLFVIPVLVGVAVVLTRTEVDGQAITVHGLRPKRRLPWPELDRLEFAGPRWAVAVSTDERRIRLPMVRPRDLPVLAAVSGGYLTFTAPPVPGSDTGLPQDGRTGAVDPGAVDPGAVDPGAVDPGAADPDAADPDAADPRTADPVAADPRTADPVAADPRTADPRTADPRTADPGTADPRGARAARADGPASPSDGPSA